MRIVFRLGIKLVTMLAMVVLMGGGLRYGRRAIMQTAGPSGPEAAQFSSEESDLMQTVFKSALRLFSGSATRDQLSGELSDKLYAGRADSATMSELGIELVKPGGDPNAPEQPAGSAKAPRPGSPALLEKRALAVAKALPHPVSDVQTALLGRVWDHTKAYNIELGLVPIVFGGMVVLQRRRRRPTDESFSPANLALLLPTDSEPYDPKHAVHALSAEDFELLIALVYQRQGYRVTMPAALSGGRGGDFTLQRKSEHILVQCKKHGQKHKVAVERVRELHEAITAAGAARGLFVASCGFSWDARNFAKTRGITLINMRTLDEQLLAAREKPTEDLLAIAPWVPKLLSKVKFTPPLCPTCEAAMDQISVSEENSVWLCTQRPECRGRRSPRKYQKAAAPAPASAAPATDTPPA